MKVSGIFAAALMAAIAGAQTYRLDDGTGESSRGLEVGGNTAVANQFTVVGGNDVLTSIEVGWGSPDGPGFSGLVGGETFRWFVWDQTSGSRWQTGQVSLVGQGTGIVSAGSIDNNVFQKVDVGSTVVAKDFYVGVAVNHGRDLYPMWLDQNGPNGNGLRSWIAGSTSKNGFDPNNVSGGFGSFRMDELGDPGAFSVRANAVPEPGMLLVAPILVAIARRRLRRV